MISIKSYVDRSCNRYLVVQHISTLKFSSPELSYGEICRRAFSRFEIIPFSPSPSGIDPTGYPKELLRTRVTCEQELQTLSIQELN